MRHWPVMAVAAWLLGAATAAAHPMGNFAVCHYTRLRAETTRLYLRHVLDLAEIPTVAEMALLDADRDGSVSQAEKQAYLRTTVPQILDGLVLTIDGGAAPLQLLAAEAVLCPGAGGLLTLRITLDLEARLTPSARPRRVAFADRNYAARTGWKEVVAVAGPGVALRASSAPRTDRSGELSAYPPEVVPPQDTTAQFTMTAAAPAPAPAADEVPAAAGPPARGDRTPRDPFTEAVGRADLGPGLVCMGLLIAWAFGALHALAPGHGKTMVAAYLVGTRGTARHAVYLGLVVTCTHTLGVFALGLAALLASAYVVPEKLYPLLSGVSGLVVFAIGLRLLYRRVRRLWAPPARPRSTAPHHHDIPTGPLTPRTLIALGVSGGLVPCPSALVVLLAAVALHRIAYGLLLIVAFSCGLAAVLVAIGLLVVCASRWLDRFAGGRLLLRRAAVVSAAVITLIGLGLILRAVEAARAAGAVGPPW
jgi:ABC-type nickel/cobalt efflux system permease component RcnA